MLFSMRHHAAVTSASAVPSGGECSRGRSTTSVAADRMSSDTTRSSCVQLGGDVLCNAPPRRYAVVGGQYKAQQTRTTNRLPIEGRFFLRSPIGLYSPK